MVVDRDRKSTLLGLLSGIIIGGAAALLFAPAKGDETRQKVRDATGQAKQKASEVAQRGRDYMQSRRSRFEEAVQEGKAAAQEKREELQHEVETRTQV